MVICTIFNGGVSLIDADHNSAAYLRQIDQVKTSLKLLTNNKTIEIDPSHKNIYSSCFFVLLHFHVLCDQIKWFFKNSNYIL